MRGLALILVLTGLATSGAGQSVSDPRVKLIDYGLFCPFPASGTAEAPMTELGRILLIDQNRKPDLRTTTIPAKQDFAFGLRVRLSEGVVAQTAFAFVEHPPLGADQITRQVWPTEPTDAASTLDLFRFEFPHEMVPGIWRLGILLDGEIALQQEFQIVPEGTLPEIEAFCDPALPIS